MLESVVSRRYGEIIMVVMRRLRDIFMNEQKIIGKNYEYDY